MSLCLQLFLVCLKYILLKCLKLIDRIFKVQKKDYDVTTIINVTPCHFLRYSSNTIVTLTEETNRSSYSDTKKLDHFTICNITF